MQVKLENIENIKKNKDNPRTIKDEKFNKLVKSIKELPQMLKLRPIVVNDDMVVLGGNMRLEACKKAGLEEVPIIKASELNEEQQKEFIIKDNSSFGEWDWDILKEDWDLQQIADWGVDIPDVEILELEPEETVGDDDIPEVQEEPITKLGDLYELGEHRLLCGDSTVITDVEKLMDGQKADMVFTDPPYNTGMTSETQAGVGGTLCKGNNKKKQKNRLSHMFNDSYSEDEWEEFMSSFCNNYNLIMKDDSVAYICLDWRRNHELVPHIKNNFKLSNIIVWDKVVHGLGSDYKYTYELINVCKKGKPKINSHQGDDAEYSDVWHIQRKMGRDNDHATKKPLKLCIRAINHSSLKNDIVSDLFLGSGSTLIACEKTKRKCFGCELEPKYVDVIIRRYINFCKDNNKPYSVKRNGEVCDDFNND